MPEVYLNSNYIYLQWIKVFPAFGRWRHAA